MKTTTKVERILGQPDYVRLFVKGTSFLLPKYELLALAESVQRVLASYAHDERPDPQRGQYADNRPSAPERAAHDRSILNTALLVAAGGPKRRRR